MGAYIPNNHSLLKREDGFVEKIIEPNAQFGVDEAQEIVDIMAEYYEFLKKLGVPVPDLYSVSRRDQQVVERAADGGDNLQKLLADKTISLEEAASLILKASAGILRQGENPQVGIDPHPANWCLKEGKLVFVDLFPPYFARKNNPLAGFPQPSTIEEICGNYERYYTAIGIFRLLRFNLVRIAGFEAEKIIRDELFSELPDLAPGILAKIKELPVEGIRKDYRTISSIIKSFNIFNNVDDLREIAMVIGEDRAFMDRILRLTTVDFRISRREREKRFKEAKKLVINNGRKVKGAV